MAWKNAIEVKVLINGEAAQEYNNNDEESHGANTVTKYIEALSGAEFEVQYELKPVFQFNAERMTFRVIIDGKVLQGVAVGKASFENSPGGWVGRLKGIKRSHGVTWSLEKYRFSEIRSSDDQTQVTNDHVKFEPAEMGTISLEVHRMHKGVYHEPGTRGLGEGWNELTPLGTIPEKALKGQALSHSTSLGMPEFVSPIGIWEGSEYLDGEHNPFTVFKFKYRSRKALQDLHIIERTRAPIPLEERPIEELSFEQARELLRRQRERQASTDAQVKAEIRPERSIKREYENDEEYSALLESARANKVPRVFEEGEIISLLED